MNETKKTKKLSNWICLSPRTPQRALTEYAEHEVAVEVVKQG